MDDNLHPGVRVETPPEGDAPTRKVSADDLRQLGQDLSRQFKRYQTDRNNIELKWLRNLRQYLGLYDADVMSKMSVTRSQAYPRLTRVKAVSVLSRLMNLMFPGNEKNWELSASPSPDMDPQEVTEMLQKMAQEDQQAEAPPQPMTRETVRRAVQKLADERATEMSLEIEDQLQEIGGDQTQDYIGMVRAVIRSGILYGMGSMEGPFVKESTATVWDIGEDGQPTVESKTAFKPTFQFLPVWDFYPDLTAKSLTEMDGYFSRRVMSRGQLRKLGDRPDFHKSQIRRYLARNPDGNYKPQSFEQELRSLGIKAEIREAKGDTARFEVVIWRGLVSGEQLEKAGVDVAEDARGDDIEAEVWMLDDQVIKVDINAWRKLGVEVRTIHTFVFDEDDTSPVGNGLPNIMRDTQMAVCAATRMLLDNASVVAGPNIEVNLDLLRPDQDVTAITAYKVWYREGTGAEAQQPAVRNVSIDGHITELMQIVELFMKFADMETFVGPGTGGDQRGTGEPMRTAAGASMLRADAALPFKDIVRNFDSLTQSVIQSLVTFNTVFNPKVKPGDYNVIARGATSLIAKEVRGMQMDQMAATMTPEDKVHVDERKFVEARFAVRDLQGLLVSPDEAVRRQGAAQQKAQEAQDLQKQGMEAEIRKTLTDALKNVAQSQKNSANADATQVNSALKVLEQSMRDEDDKRE